MEYLDFELRIAQGSGRDYPVTVVRSPAGVASGTLRFPFDTLALEHHLRGVELAVIKSGSLRRDVAMASPETESVADFGKQLFQSLFSEQVQTAFRRSQDRAQGEHKGLRVRLRIEAPELATLPWEFLYDPSEGDYVCLSTGTPVIRYLEFERPPDVLTVQPPISVLGVIASPSDRSALDVRRERERIEQATADLRASGYVQIDWMPGSTWRDLQRAMRRGTYHVLHFVGHGGYDPASGEGVLAFTDDDGRSALLGATEVGRLLADHKSLRLVVLNACLGARGSSTDIFSSTSSILVRRGVPAVVAMQYEISDLAAIEFSRSFYEAIADGMPVDAAVAEARKAVSVSSRNSVEWATPVLHMSAPDGVLFRIAGPPIERGTTARVEETPASAVVPAAAAPAATTPASRGPAAIEEVAAPAPAAAEAAARPLITPLAATSAADTAPSGLKDSLRVAGRFVAAAVIGVVMALLLEMTADDLGIGWGEAASPTLLLTIGCTALMWFVLGRTGPFKPRPGPPA